jgi:hypothetical protein
VELIDVHIESVEGLDGRERGRGAAFEEARRGPGRGAGAGGELWGALILGG